MPNKNGQFTENEIQSQIRQILQLNGWMLIRIQQGLGAHKGMSDLIAVKDGRTVFIEVKTPRGRLSDNQNIFCEQLRAHGGEYFVMRCIGDTLALTGERVT